MEWKIFAFRMGNFQGRLILLVFYFTIVAPFGIINRFFRDPLHEKKPTGDSFWFTLTTPEKKIEEVVTPTPEEVQEISNPSPYANDLIILKIEQDIKRIDKELQETDLKEASLNPPLLDMDIKFEVED